jgi:hypothetical protein
MRLVFVTQSVDAEDPILPSKRCHQPGWREMRTISAKCTRTSGSVTL